MTVCSRKRGTTRLDRTIKISKKSFKNQAGKQRPDQLPNDLLALCAELRSSKTSSLDFLRDSVRHVVARIRGKYWHSSVGQFASSVSLPALSVPKMAFYTYLKVAVYQ